MIRLVKKAASAIANAAAGTKWFFIDNDGRLATKDEEGNVVEYTPLGTFDTDEVDEGAENLYYTEARVSANEDVAANTAARHAAVSLGTPSGLSLDGQEVSLALATDSTPGAMPAADKAKTDHLTVTAATNLDSIRTRVDELDAAVVLQGEWNPTTGTFPGGGSAQPGQSWIVTGDADVDGIEFRDGDRITALVEDASTTVYAGNWLKQDYTDRVSSVHGRVGNVVGASGDYDASQVDNDSGVAGASVAAALDTLDSEKADASELGTAATRDTGPALNQVPAGQDLVDGLVLGANNRFAPVALTKSFVGGAHADEIVLLHRVTADGGSGGRSRQYAAYDLMISTSSTSVTGTYKASGTVDFIQGFGTVRAGFSFSRSVSSGSASDPLGKFTVVRVSYNGFEYYGVRAVFGVARSKDIFISGFERREDTTDTGRLKDIVQVVETSEVTVLDEAVGVISKGNAGAAFEGRPGDSIGDNGAVRNPNQDPGEFTNTGPGLDEVPTGQVLSDGRQIDAHTAFWTQLGGYRVPKGAGVTASNDVILVLGRESGTRSSFSGVLIIGGNTTIAGRATSAKIDISTMRSSPQAADFAVSYRGISSLTTSGSFSVQGVTFEVGGVLHAGLRFSATTSDFFEDTRNNFYLLGLQDDGNSRGELYKLVTASSVSNIAAAPSRHFGAPGDSVGNNGSYRRPSQSLGATNAVEYGTSTQSGDGSTVEFLIPHGLGATPQSWSVSPGSWAVAEKHRVTADGTNLIVTFDVAPASATDNLVMPWTAMRAIT